MPQSLFKSYYHIVFSTKRRKPFLEEDKLRENVFHFLVVFSKKLKVNPIAVGGFNDHVHLLLHCGKYTQIPKIICLLKERSCKWIRSSGFTEFGWQGGYAAYSVSPTHVQLVKHYIQNQKEHHQAIDFKSELIQILYKNQIHYDEKYIWDWKRPFRTWSLLIDI